MTTLDAPRDAPKSAPHSLRALWRRALDRPLTTYYLLLGASGLLLIVGLLMVMSSSSVYSYNTNDGDSYAVFKRQLTWVAIGVPAALIAGLLPLRWIRRLAWLGMGVAIVLVSLTHTPLGVVRNGQVNWLGYGGLVMQPSEFAKLAMIIWAAHIFALKEKRLHQISHVLFPVVPGLLALIGLVAISDLGTGLVMFTILLALVWVVGTPLKMFALAASGVTVVALSLAASSQERISRLTSFTDPLKHFEDEGWQPAHGLFALSQGGVWGEGIGASHQKWGRLPEAHTDFIFAVLGEELGLMGTLLVVTLFVVIAYAGVRVARETEDPFVRYASFGFVAWLLGQAMLNIGMVLTLFPVIGIPLPLLSYGGSSMIWTLIALGLLISFARREPATARALAERKAKVR